MRTKWGLFLRDETLSMVQTYFQFSTTSRTPRIRYRPDMSWEHSMISFQHDISMAENSWPRHLNLHLPHFHAWETAELSRCPQRYLRLWIRKQKRDLQNKGRKKIVLSHHYEVRGLKGEKKALLSIQKKTTLEKELATLILLLQISISRSISSSSASHSD